MWKTFKIFWKANPWFKVTVGFLTIFAIALGLAGAPPLMWAFIAAIFIALGIGTWFNVRKLKKYYEQRDKIRADGGEKNT